MQRQPAYAAAVLLLPSFNRHSSHGPRCRQSIGAPRRRDQSHRSHPAPLLQRPLRATLDGKRINAEESRLCLARAIANAVTEKFNGHNWVEQRGAQHCCRASTNVFSARARRACRNTRAITKAKNTQPRKLSFQSNTCSASPGSFYLRCFLLSMHHRAAANHTLPSLYFCNILRKHACSTHWPMRSALLRSKLCSKLLVTCSAAEHPTTLSSKQTPPAK
jgi:hypothetical protein